MGDSLSFSNFQEIGATGLNVSGGLINEEPLRVLSGDGWRRTLRDMMNDAVINAIMNTIEMLARQTSWNIEPFTPDNHEDEKDAEFFRECLFRDMEQAWQDCLSEFLTFLWFGWNFPEICYKKRLGESRDKTKDSNYSDGKVGWRKFAPRAQESLEEWKFDEFGDVLAMVQAPEPDRITRIIPFEKALHLRTTSNKNNPEARSIFRGAYRSWYFKSNFENIEAIGIERDMAGLPVATAPADHFTDSATPAQRAILRNLGETVKKVKNGESAGLVVPVQYDEKGKLLYEFKLLSAGGQRQFDTSKVIDRYDHRILMSVLADFLLLGSQKVGSYALSTDKTELFASAMGSWLDTICDQFNRFAIPRLQKLNGRDRKRCPRLIHGPVERVSLADLGAYIAQLSGANITLAREEQEYLIRQAIPPQKKKSVTDEKNAAEAEEKESPEESDKPAEK